MNGGYTLLDATGVQLELETTQTVPGIFANTTKAVTTGKPIWATGCTYSGRPVTPMPMFVVSVNGRWVCTSGKNTVTISADDSVLVAS